MSRTVWVVAQRTWDGGDTTPPLTTRLARVGQAYATSDLAKAAVERHWGGRIAAGVARWRWDSHHWHLYDDDLGHVYSVLQRLVRT